MSTAEIITIILNSIILIIVLWSKNIQKERVTTLNEYIEKSEKSHKTEIELILKEIAVEKKELLYYATNEFSKHIKTYMEENAIDNEKQEFIDRFSEMSSVVESMLLEMNEKEMNEFINYNLPLNKDSFDLLKS